MHHGPRARLAPAFLAVACGAPGGGPDASAAWPDGGAPTLAVEVGTGVAAFQPLADGDLVDIAAGPQGGFHIWTAARVEALGGDRAQLRLSARNAQTDALVGPPSEVAAVMTQGTGNASEKSGLTNFVDDPESIRGVSVVLRVEVLAPDGRWGFDERVVVPR
jgi:hypothetical protein